VLEARHKQWLKLIETADKTLRARNSKAFDGKAVRDGRRALLAADPKKNEDPTVRDAVLDALKQAAYFIHQVHWLHSRFPHGLFEDIPGLCKAVTVEEIAANDYSLTPGRYVGVAAAAAEDEDDFAETLREIHDELAELNDKAELWGGTRNFRGCWDSWLAFESLFATPVGVYKTGSPRFGVPSSTWELLRLTDGNQPMSLIRMSDAEMDKVASSWRFAIWPPFPVKGAASAHGLTADHDFESSSSSSSQ
jgi:hypothetical protein